MATFAQWLKVQLNRHDNVGEFARLWEGMEGKPRLSSPVSIWRYLEGFNEKDQLKPFYDAALAEYQGNRGATDQPDASPGETMAQPVPIRPGLPVAEVWKPPGMQNPQKLPDPPAWAAGDPAKALTDLGSINMAFAQIRGFMHGLSEMLGLAQATPDPAGGTIDRWTWLYAKIQAARDNVTDGTEAAIVLQTVSEWMDQADTEPEPEPGPAYDWQQVYAVTDWTQAGEGA